MKRIKQNTVVAAVALTLVGLSSAANAAGSDQVVSDDVIAGHRANLASNMEGAGFGPQSPRDINAVAGSNARIFETAPAYTEMNLCNIHMHESAEHKGGEFTTYAGNGDGKGYGTGFKYDGELSESELATIDYEVGKGGLVPGDTIEVHYVHSTAQVVPGPTLGACLSESIANPQLRVETQVFVLVNDAEALDFMELTEIAEVNGVQQAVNILSNTGEAVQYAGSTTGPGYNEAGSPLQVSWSVRPQVAKVDIKSVANWFADNVFDEDHAHGVRNLVLNTDLLSPIN